MAYTLKRAARIVEQLNLEDEAGKTVKIIDVDLDIDTVTARYNRAKNELIKAERLLSEHTDAVTYEQYGKAFVDLLGVIFAADDVAAIVDFYENKYIELLTALLPWLQNVVEPQLKERADEKIAAIKKMQAQQARRAAKK